MYALTEVCCVLVSAIRVRTHPTPLLGLSRGTCPECREPGRNQLRSRVFSLLISHSCPRLHPTPSRAVAGFRLAGYSFELLQTSQSSTCLLAPTHLYPCLLGASVEEEEIPFCPPPLTWVKDSGYTDCSLPHLAARPFLFSAPGSEQLHALPRATSFFIRAELRA